MNRTERASRRPSLAVDATLATIDKLCHSRAYRQATGLYFVEGVRHFVQAIEHHADIETLVWSEKLLTVPIARKLLREARRRGCPTVTLTPEQFRRISRTPRASGVGAVLRQHWVDLHTLKPASALCWTVLGQVRFAGNLGTLIRSSEAVGGGGFILLDGEADPFEPGAVRAAMGSLFRQRFVRTTTAALTRWLRAHRCCVVGASPDGAHDYRELTFSDQPVVLLLGEERKGLSAQQRGLCQKLVRIPIQGQVDSLNLAVAGSLLLYEVLRYRA